jgi:hypothetical protein
MGVQVNDEKRSITVIFWLVLAFVFSVMATSVGGAWAFLKWAGYVESQQLWPALVVLGIGLLGALGILVGILVWLLRRIRE